MEITARQNEDEFFPAHANEDSTTPRRGIISSVKSLTGVEGRNYLSTVK